MEKLISRSEGMCSSMIIIMQDAAIIKISTVLIGQVAYNIILCNIYAHVQYTDASSESCYPAGWNKSKDCQFVRLTAPVCSNS